MRRSLIPTLALSAAIVAACGEQPTTTYELSVSPAVHAKGATPTNYGTHLTGDAERPTPVQTQAQGQLKLQLSKDGQTLSYKLIVANIENVTMAHLHKGTADAAGGVVVWLYPSAPPPAPIPGRSDGVLAEGEITAADLRGALAGQPLSRLISNIESDSIYVNVHTSAYPAGEVRGQL